jgi:hypothetical protein
VEKQELLALMDLQDHWDNQDNQVCKENEDLVVQPDPLDLQASLGNRGPEVRVVFRVKVGSQDQ